MVGMMMNDPITKARWVTEAHGITDIPALSLKTVAETENIKYLFDDFPDDPGLAGMLLFKGTKRRIIVNTHIPNVGRQNFTFAHELGHYFMGHPPSYNQDGKSGFRCTTEDIDREQKPREVEANRFAVELLMPESRFRLDMAGAPIDFGLIDSLAKQYMVSKQACSNRILSLTLYPCVIILTKGNGISSWGTSRAAGSALKRMKTIPVDTMAHASISNQRWQREFVSCAADKWLMRSVPGDKVYECTHIHQESGTAMTILKW